MSTAAIHLAQRLGEWRSKTVARLLGVFSVLLAFALVQYSFLWLLKIDLLAIASDRWKLTSFVLICVGLPYASWRLWSTKSDEQKPEPATVPYKKELLHISFNYLPTSPFENGWKLRDGTPADVVFSKPAIVDGTPAAERGLTIRAKGRFSMDWIVSDPGIRMRCTEIAFKAVMDSRAIVYLGVILNDRSGDRIDSGKDGGIFWVDYKLAEKDHPVHSTETEEGWTNERVIRITGTNLTQGWQSFSRKLQSDIDKTYPGLVLRELHCIRLRNSMSIAPIWLY
jgi:hypothetical protein